VLPLLAVPLLLAADLNPPPLALDTMTVAQARDLGGRAVTIRITSAKPADFRRGKTVVGCPDRDDGTARSAVSRGTRYDVDGGKAMTVTGTLEVIDHPARRVGAVLVMEWTEIRVTE